MTRQTTVPFEAVKRLEAHAARTLAHRKCIQTHKAVPDRAIICNLPIRTTVKNAVFVFHSFVIHTVVILSDRLKPQFPASFEGIDITIIGTDDNSVSAWGWGRIDGTTGCKFPCNRTVLFIDPVNHLVLTADK